MCRARFIHVLSVFALLVQLAGCATPLESAEQRNVRSVQLARELMALSPAVSQREANVFARTAVDTAAELGRKYGVELHPWLHNASIHLGLKQRGFCYEYQEDLYAGLKTVTTEHLALHFIEANRGKLNEHHALSVTSNDAEWDSGLVLDAWRYNGNLYFMPVKADTKYPWLQEGGEALSPAPESVTP